MATRLRLCNAAAPYVPPTIRGTWNVVTQTGASLMSVTPAGAGQNVSQACGVSTQVDVVLRRFVSAPFTSAGALAGTVSWMALVNEDVITTNARWKMHIYVTAGDTDTVRGTVLNGSVDTVEWPAATGTGVGRTAQALTSVDCSIGDRIVAICGWRAFGGSTSTAGTGTLRYGGTGADLTSGATTTTTPGWIEFSAADALFVPSTALPSGQHFHTMGHHQSHAVGELWTPRREILRPPRRRPLELARELVPA